MSAVLDAPAASAPRALATDHVPGAQAAESEPAQAIAPDRTSAAAAAPAAPAVAPVLLTDPPAPDPRSAPRSGAVWPLRVLAVVALVMLLPAAKPFLLPVVLAVLLAIVLAGPVRSLEKLGVPESLGALLVVLALLTGVGIVVAALAEPASAWLERAPSNVAQLMQSLERLRDSMPLLHAATVGGTTAADGTAIGATLKSEGMNLTKLALEQATGFAVAAVSTVILLYFLLASQNWLLIRLMQRVRSRHARLHGLCMGRSAQRDIAHFLLTMLMINVLLGIATGLALWAIGLPNPLLWGTVTAVLNFVPYLGPLVLMAMLLLAGVLTFDSFGMMVAPPLLFLGLNALETYLLSPLIVGKRLDLNPVFVFLSVMFWGWAWGVAGTLVAVPLLLAIRHACRHSRGLRPVASWLERPVDTGKTIQSLLRPEPRPRWWKRRSRTSVRPDAVMPPGMTPMPPEPPPPR